MSKAEAAMEPRLEIPADEHRLSEVREFVTRAGERLGFTGRGLANIRLAVDEACTNVVKHAYPDGPGTLSVAVAARRGWLEIRIADQGRAFDGRVEMPHLGQWIDARRKGGFGVYLMHRLMDEVRYETTPAGNEWILRKRLPRPPSELSRRLRRRYASGAALIVILGTALVAVPLALHEGHQRAREEQRSLLARAHALAEASRPALLEHAELSREQTRLFEAVKTLTSQEPRLLAVTVVDRDLTIWASDRESATFTRFLEPAGLGSPDEQGTRWAREHIEGVPVLHVAVPVHVGTETGELGAVHLTLHWGATARAIRAVQIRIASVSLGGDVLAVLLVVAFLTHLLTPLQRLVDGVRALGQGGPEVTVEGPEEIGAIAAAFNDIHTRYRAAQESAAEHARLQEEMQLAREIQSNILPQNVPEIPGFEIARAYCPAAEVGGDYYDFLEVGPGLTGVVVADVAGKGVPGSLVMSMVRTALRMETRSNAHAGDVLARLHAFITPDLRQGMFVTMLYLVLDSRNRVVSYASAGHTPMLLYRARTDEALVLEPHGMPVGLAGSDTAVFQRTLDVERLRLQAGDLLVLYTDGVTEARSPEGEEYGEDRLLAALRRWGAGSAEDFVHNLEAEVVAFTGGERSQDDLTVVAIKERQAAPHVAGDVQRKLFDLVEREGVPVAEASARLQVSPSTYYRLKHASLEAGPRVARVVGPGDSSAPAPESATPGSTAARTGAVPVPAANAGRPAPHASPPGAPSGGPEAGLRGTLERPESPPDCTVVHLQGALDTSACRDFEDILHRARAQAQHLVIDLGRVAYVSSRGWGLVASARTALRPQGELVLCGLSSALRDVYRMLGFEPLVRAYADVPAALAGLIQAIAEPSTVEAAVPAPGELATLALATPADAPAVAAVTVLEPAADARAPADAVHDWESLRVRVGGAGPERRVTLVALTGVLDTVTAAKLRQVFEDLVADGARCLLVDLSCLEFVSSAGWGCFTVVLSKLRAAGGDLRLFGMSQRLSRIFGLLHLRTVLQSFDVLADALASFGVVPDVPAETAGGPAASPDAPTTSGTGAPQSPNASLAETRAAGDTSIATDDEVGRTLVQADDFVAHLEPFGRGRRARWLRLQGRATAEAGAHLGSILSSCNVTLLFVDARPLAHAEPEFWDHMARHARTAVQLGGSLYVIGSDAWLPPAGLGLTVYPSAAAALRAHQGKNPPPLPSDRAPDTEFHRDASLRREGWDTYVAFLQDALGEDAA